MSGAKKINNAQHFDVQTNGVIEGKEWDLYPLKIIFRG